VKLVSELHCSPEYRRLTPYTNLIFQEDASFTLARFLCHLNMWMFNILEFNDDYNQSLILILL